MADLILNMVLSLLAASGLSMYAIRVLQVGKYIKHKPFTCAPCLCFWLGMLMYNVPIEAKCIAIVCTYTILIHIIYDDKYNG